MNGNVNLFDARIVHNRSKCQGLKGGMIVGLVQGMSPTMTRYDSENPSGCHETLGWILIGCVRFAFIRLLRG